MKSNCLVSYDICLFFQQKICLINDCIYFDLQGDQRISILIPLPENVIIITYNYLDSPINTAGGQEALSLEGPIWNFEISHNTIRSTKKEGIDCKVGCHDGKIAYNDVVSVNPDIYLDCYGHDQ
jgi:hypothetical protein